jgi:hypothetical protein
VDGVGGGRVGRGARVTVAAAALTGRRVRLRSVAWSCYPGSRQVYVARGVAGVGCTEFAGRCGVEVADVGSGIFVVRVR